MINHFRPIFCWHYIPTRTNCSVTRDTVTWPSKEVFCFPEKTLSYGRKMRQSLARMLFKRIHPVPRSSVIESRLPPLSLKPEKPVSAIDSIFTFAAENQQSIPPNLRIEAYVKPRQHFSGVRKEHREQVNLLLALSTTIFVFTQSILPVKTSGTRLEVLPESYHSAIYQHVPLVTIDFRCRSGVVVSLLLSWQVFKSWRSVVIDNSWTSHW